MSKFKKVKLKNCNGKIIQKNNKNNSQASISLKKVFKSLL